MLDKTFKNKSYALNLNIKYIVCYFTRKITYNE